MRNSTDRFVNEVIVYGGVPMRRCDVYAVCLEDTQDKRCADYFAFGSAQKAIDAEPVSIAEFRAWTR